MTITELKEKILSGYRITRNDELTIFKICDFMELCQAADEIREKFSGNQVELCSIINCKSGHCSENCRFCAQSAFNKTDCETYDFIEDEKIIARAVQDANEGVHRFAIVTSGRSLSGADFEEAINVYKKMSSTLKMNFCASFGFLTKDQLLRLKDAGVTHYHHNIETSRWNHRHGRDF